MPFPSPGALPDPGIKPASSALAGGFFTTEPAGKPIAGDTPTECTPLPGHVVRVYLLLSVSPTKMSFTRAVFGVSLSPQS